MREIKFRGITNEFSSPRWVYGDLICDCTDEPRIMTDYHDCYDPVTWTVDPATVGQFTGLRDADRREIYEGDVIRVCGANGIVVYSEGAFIVRFEKGPSLLSHCICGDFSNPVRVSSCRVIGNVHDNPALMEVEHD